MKGILLFFVVYSSISSAQKLEYLPISKDQYGAEWSYSFDKKTTDGFYSWVKVVYTATENPDTESTEYFVEFKCSDRTMSDEIVKIKFRDQKYQIDRKKMPFRSILEKSIFNPLLEKFCK
ncbi:hypothetical protein [Chryseobacterium pennipullorum]|uniref:Uncharacterized protein n=1 Tax=Chryseobacterium pennipullorum TaxID=2258963 RepID=A0A3D9AYS7_9FLAO|nr:hypothetical protein [Chryseobacterium pennipullorum]REC46440.1 hypothetical protein DRF67_14275 [Chryseobacterium pennipullorum]